MSLLHRQIAERSIRNEPVSHRVDRLLTFVGGEMSSPPMKASVGGGVGGIFTFISDAEVNQLAADEDRSFTSLERDMYDHLVYDDPSKVNDAAKEFRDLAATAPTDEIKQSQLAIADSLDASVKRLNDRISKLSSDDVKSQIAWSSSYRAFMADWRAFYDQHFPNEKDIIGSMASTYWNQITEYDHSYRGMYVSYPSSAGKPSQPMPSTPEDKLDAIRKTGGTSGISIPWTPILIGAGVVGALLYFRPKILHTAT